MRNEEGIDKSKVATKFNFKSYDAVFYIVVRCSATGGKEVR